MFVNQLLALQTALIAAGPLGEIIHVPTDAPTIQACIDAAVSGQDECVVAPGTYNELINFLGKAITLRSSGGRGVTTIDATGIGGSVVTCDHHEGPDSVLMGFAVRGGSGSDSNGTGYTIGGGMRNFEGSPSVIDCVFLENVVTGGGGGMHNIASDPTVVDCVFSFNSSGGGGGMFNEFSHPVITNCAFLQNVCVPYHGGGVYNYASHPVMSWCEFRGNTAERLGGGMYNYASRPSLEHCRFAANVSRRSDGGGMHNEYDSSPTLIDCAFEENTAAYAGGAISNWYDSNPMIRNSAFLGNRAGIGGGIRNYASHPTLMNGLFSRNRAYDGGGMYNSGSASPIVNHCTFSANHADARGGGISNHGFGAALTIANSILRGNSPDEIARDGTFLAVGFSNVKGGLPNGSVDRGGNLDLDSAFVRRPDPGLDGIWDTADDDHGDLRLQPGSPCINAGDPDFVPATGETDLDGHARVLCDQVDMGAYEFGIADYDCNQEVNLTDFAAWEACMLGPKDSPPDNGCEAFDANLDFDVDLRDFSIFQNSLTTP